ncbi:MAG: UDP-N-acetylmuramoyl-L-alanyl-D-glutamate--2,6-diaminopimelate ligase [Actinomycetota bacterium]
MRLGTIGRLWGCDVPPEAGEIAVTDLRYDSRAVVPGCLFFCVVGAHTDGHDRAVEAVQAGAAALVCERRVELPVPMEVPQLIVENSRRAMGALAGPFYGNPSHRVKVAGVTGTNGKTTTCFMLESIFRAAGDPAGLIGTVECRVAGDRRPATRTTPEAVDIQRLLAEMVDRDVNRCALEATSIGIESGRTEGTKFEAAVFTNLTHDHLDHHKNMEAYFRAKARLFREFDVRTAVINADDKYGRRLLRSVEGRKVSFGVNNEADIRAAEVVSDADGSTFVVRGDGVDQRVRVRLPGAFNVSNALAATVAALCMGIPADAAAAGIEGLEAVPGRFEPVKLGQDFLVLVDYAHTPDSLVSVLRAARDLADAQVITVFGCGGDRDKAKRPLMAQAVAEAADVAIVTSDNPRGEDPEAILRDIEQGLVNSPPRGGYVIIEDRAEAIRAAVSRARTGDVVVVAGKGHETYQEVDGRVLPFDDRDVAAQMLRELL